MLNAAYIFPGQGAQYVGMGEDLYHQYPQAKEVFECAARILGSDFSRLIFKGPLSELSRTINCQLAVFIVSIACLRTLQAQTPAAAINVKYAAGLSLGEYTALVAAGALGFEQALKLVRIRAEYMEQASLAHPGGMVSLIGLSLDTAKELCAKTKIEVANLNCPGQIVISGDLTALERAKELAIRLGAKKAIPLNVSGAFHSSLMAPAQQGLVKALAEVDIHSVRIPLVSNVTAKEEAAPEEIKDNLARQVASSTHWADSVRFIVSGGVKAFLEIGPGKVLKGILRKIDPQLQVYNIGTVQELEAFLRGAIHLQ